MAQETSGQEMLEFRAEVQQLLNILAHSLYTEREIFLRELISNASDALHRMQFVLLTDRSVNDSEAELAIWIEGDKDARTLIVTDTGVGMTRDELIENLGTIAHSGAMAFLRGLEEGQRPADIIGQFGVGFYSVFMVAEEVAVVTRSYRPDATAWRWTSRGDSQFVLAPADKATRGTRIEIKLKEDAAEFASQWRLEQAIRRHSDFVSFPIYVEGRVVNQQTALWRQPLQDVKEEEYAAFYRQLTLAPEDPLLHIHLVTDAPVNIRSILYVPRELPRGPLQARADYGLRLYSKKVLIQERSKELLPEYLRFVEGVVDSEDVPLNISRETVQSSQVMRQIRKALTGRILRALRELADERPADYAGLWREFGAFIKQGLVTSPADRDDLLLLLRFHSSMSGADVIPLSVYASRMREGQEAIYYMLAADAAGVERSPHLDSFRARSLEVLTMYDPFDGLVVQSIGEFGGKPLQSVDDPDLELPTLADAPAEPQPEAPAGDFDQLVARVKRVLAERVADVRASRLLTNSPGRLVSAISGPERDLERMRHLLEEDYEIAPKILELNPRHPLIRNLSHLIAERPSDAVIDAAIEQLLDNLLLLEGLHSNPARMVPRIEALLEAATRAGAGGDAPVAPDTEPEE